MITREHENDHLFELEGRLQQTSLKLRDMATMGALITSILEMDTILSVVMEMSIRMVDAEVGLIQLMENGELAPKATWGIDDAILKGFTYKDGLNVVNYCFEKQEPVLFSKKDDECDFGPTIKGLLAMPIKSRSKCHGTLIVINKAIGEYFNEEDLENLEMLVNFASVAIDNAALLKESLQKQKMEQELAIARQIQETILPEKDTKIEGVEIGILYRPARFVSGDFYDIIKIGATDFLMIIGDVSSKGVPAAMLMSATTAIIRAEIMKNPKISSSQLMYNLNNVLANGIIKSNDMFVTIFIARLDLAKMKMSYCNAGHNPPFYWDSDNCNVVELTEGGPFVGQFPEVNYIYGEHDISRGDKILAYTDGVTEAEDIHKGQFGVERLLQAFLNEKNVSASEFCAKVGEWVDRFTEGASDEPFDDFTLFEVLIKKVKSIAIGQEERFKYRSDSQSEPRMFNEVKAFLVENNIAKELLYNILLTISEGFTNALIHGNNYDKNKWITINLTVNEEAIFADIIDEGDGNIDAIYSRKPSDETKEGGRGIDLIQHYTDDLQITKCQLTGGIQISMKFLKVKPAQAKK